MALNLQFLEGSNINNVIAGHDEYIAVKEVYSIIHPLSFKHFFMAVISGNALYYGRIMFYIDALVAYIPFVVFGVKGMVLTIRMFHALLIVASLILLAKTFFEKQWQKYLLFVSVALLYYTMYFIMMPKPEPMQLFFLSWFFNRFKAKKYQFSWSFILLGIAYGIKFNVLLMLPIICIIPFLYQSKFEVKTHLKPALKALAGFVIGLIIAVPCLAFSVIRPIFLQTYLHETFGGTEKGYDNANLDMLQWMDSGLGGSYLGLGALAIPFVGFIGFLLFKSIKHEMRTKDFAASMLLSIGLLMAIFIMFKTKRLWPHYLWTAYIFMVVGALIGIAKTESKYLKTVLITCMMIFISSSMFFSLTRELPLFLTLSKTEEVQKDTKWSKQTIDYIKNKYPNSRISTDGSILYPFEDFVKVDIYHPFEGKAKDETSTAFYWYSDKPENMYTENNDLLVFYKRLPERMLKEKPNIYVGQQEELYKQFKSKIPSVYQRDTSFGEIIVYKKK
ncbi:MAG TPA: hypothetical protein VGF79_02175 [Bacteroidia bacterium]